MPAGASETLFIPLAGRARVARYEDILDHCTADLLIRRPEGGMHLDCGLDARVLRVGGRRRRVAQDLSFPHPVPGL